MTVQKFKFEAINKEGAPLSGYLFSENREEAHQRLKKEGFAVLSLSASQEIEKEDSSIIKFEFEATNKEEKDVRGEIQATNEYEAYKKLQLEYHFEPISLVNKNLPFEEKQKIKKQGIPIEIEERFWEEEEKLGEKKKKIPSKDININNQEKVDILLEKKLKQMHAIKEEIEVILGEISSLLKEYGDCIEEGKKRDIQRQVDKLARLRNSNSIEHLENVMKKLFKIILNDDIFITLQDQYTPDFDQKKQAFKEMIIDLSNRFKKRITSLKIELNLKKFEDIFKGTQTEKLDFLWTFIHRIFLFFFLFLLTFFWFQILRLILRWDENRALFYLQSEFLWICIFFSGLLYLFIFLHTLFIKKSILWKKRCIFYTALFLCMGILFLEFPVVFFWTH